jgi:hypothetical protein
MATNAELLAEARDAYHKLQTGALDVEIHTSSGEVVKYAAVDVAKLEGYIARLESRAASDAGARRARSVKIFY